MLCFPILRRKFFFLLKKMVGADDWCPLLLVPVIFEVFKVFCFILTNVLTEDFLIMFQQPRKAKAVFHGHLTKFNLKN